jgi:hypothetical protein
MAGLALVGLAATASAQVVGRFADLPLRLKVGDAVMIDARSDASFEGRLVRITSEQLVVAGPGPPERVFAAAEVQRVRRRGDGLGNGLRLGAVIGGIFGCGVFGAFSGEFRVGDCVQSLLIFGAAGAGLGLAVDAIHTGATTVFESPSSSARGWPRHDGVTARATVWW